MSGVVVNEQSSPTTKYYVWEPPGKNVTIHLDFGVVDRMLVEVMRGFGAIPRRGAEVGGILLGSAETGEKTVIRIEDFEPVVCEHRLGPSFLLSEADTARYDEAIARHRYNPEKRIYAVGCYRSHTREGMALSSEDLAHFDSYFPNIGSVQLLVKPYATRVSVAGFFFREEGGAVRSEAPYLEFPFRRRELGGGAPPSRTREAHPPPAANSYATGYPPPEASSNYGAAAPEEDCPEYEEQPQEDYGSREPEARQGFEPAAQVPTTKLRRTNVWIPLSFIFLLLGCLVGFQAALTYRPAKAAGILNDPYSLSLAVGRSGDYLQVRWDRHAPAVKTAQRGVLTITEGTYDKKVDLDVLQLQNPTVYYRNMSDEVRFRLDVYTKERVSVAESIEWRR